MNGLNLMIKIFMVLVLFILPTQQKLQYSNGKPTSYGINNYVKSNERYFLKEFIRYSKDSIYNDIFFSTKNFKKTTDKKDYIPEVLAYNESYQNYSCEIVVNNEEKFQGFEYKNNKLKEYYNQNDYFIKPTVLHEIMHYYFNQCALELQVFDSIEVNQYYKQGIIMFPNMELEFGAKFIEEGICEYFIQKYGEVPELKQYYTPKIINDLKNKNNRFDILYGYASQYVRDFCDLQILKFGKIKYPIMIILKNRPPNYMEILDSQKYFQRLQ
jgi:hypothetical protein